jgi:hypothetical protein
VFIAPFTKLLSAPRAGIQIGDQSNLEDNTIMLADGGGGAHRAQALARVGLHPNDGVVIAARTVFGHDATVIGPVRIGIGGGPIAADPDGVPEVILNQGAQVDGAWLEQNTAVLALGRVGPGVRLHSGFEVLPGKNVTTQAEADDPSLGKVAPITEADVQGTELSIEANTAFARDYSRLSLDDPSNVLGINFSPGGSRFSPRRDLPVTGAAPGTCDGRPTRDPAFRNRVIGPVCFSDSLARLQRTMGAEIALRADEGAGVPYEVGPIGRMDSEVVFHDVEGAGITTGSVKRN